jgi:hypothetical protein
MRRDLYIENDSGGFSVVAADAVDAIIEDQRSDDFKFVKDRKAMLIELYGDDSMVVRTVVDEPLTADEAAQWLARYTWEIDSSDGRMLVMGGFDPDVLSWWKEESSANHTDGRGVGAVSAAPGRWRVDVYAHVGSMNGRVILDEAGEKVGVAFRRAYTGRAFPLWLAHMLDFSGEDDPGHEELWKDVKGSMNAGKLSIDTDSGDAVGFLVHFTRSTTSLGEPPEEVWIGRSENSRIPATFPLGLRSEVPDPGIRSFHDKLLDIKHPEPPRPIADTIAEIIESWPGDPLKPVEGGPVALPPREIYLLHWIAGLTSDATPRFELWVEARNWSPPASTPDFAVITKRGSVTAIGPVMNSGGWHTWWTARDVANVLTAIPDGATIDFAMMPNAEERENPDSPVGRALYSGRASGGVWQISEASPRVTRATLEQALAFARDLVNGRIQVRDASDRKILDAAIETWLLPDQLETVRWQGNVMSLAEPDERLMIMVGGPLFRSRFGDTWPMDVEEELDDDEGDL